MHKLFPFIEKKNIEKLQIDSESIHFITTRIPAEKITNIICMHLEKLNLRPEDIVITDCTSGCGGNTISFAKKFKHIHAIEIEKNRCECLYNNLELYNLKNVDINNNDCIKLLPIISDHDVIFIDPPWGGINYKLSKLIDISISGLTLNDMYHFIFDKEKMKKNPLFLVIKLPKNFNFDTLHIPYIKYELRKMYIIISQYLF
jgi:16S rRNA G966 N2-methylase RsmD